MKQRGRGETRPLLFEGAALWHAHCKDIWIGSRCEGHKVLARINANATRGGFMIARVTRRLVVAGCLLAIPALSQAADQLKLAVGAPNNWDTCIPEVGQRA